MPAAGSLPYNMNQSLELHNAPRCEGDAYKASGPEWHSSRFGG